MKKLLQLALCSFLLLVISCGKDEADADAPLLVLSSTDVILENTSASGSVEITSNCAWSITVSEGNESEWLSISPTSGQAGKTLLTFTARANSSYFPRSCSLKITGRGNGIKERSLPVEQLGTEAPEGSEIAGLIAIYRSTGGKEWINKRSWMTDDPLSNWYGIQVDEDNHVTSIYLTNNNLKGRLPDIFANFPYLQKLEMRNNTITGPIPPSMGELENLEVLDLTVNTLSGLIPVEITNLKKLKTLSINDNPLSGSIPAEIGSMESLQSLSIHNSNISGTIPESIGNLTKLTTITFSYASLSGAIPESMANLTSLTSFGAQKNNLTGSIPAGFTNLTELKLLDLSFNNLSGALPAPLMSHIYWDLWILSPQKTGYGFSNLNDNLESDDYSEDGKVITYATKQKGNGVDLIFMGDGFTSQDMGTGGFYETTMAKAIEALFSYEPFKTYREYFNLYIVKVVSPQNGISQPGYMRKTALSTRYQTEKASNMSADRDKVYEYAAKAPLSQSLQNISVALITNSKRHGGTAYMYTDGPGLGISTLAHTFEGTLVHETGGHVFGRLGDEYTGGYSIPEETKTWLRNNQANGFYLNLSLTGDPAQVPWNHFIGLPNYEMVGVYEGGHYYAYGVWRPENNSIMKQSQSGADFNAPSRELIVRRIMNIAGESYSFSSFLAKDVIPPETRGTCRPALLEAPEDHTPPVIIEGSYIPK